MIQAIGKNQKYVKRYFKIDTDNGTLSYADSDKTIDTKP